MIFNFESVDMSGKVCLVTGATSGIGFAVAQGLAQMNAEVVLCGPDEASCLDAVEEIRRKTGNASVDYLAGDLSIQAEVRRTAAEFKNCYSRLDVLINNAAGVFLNRRRTVDGVEMTFALNHLSYFLLTNLLLNTLIASEPARVVNVTSAIFNHAVLNFDDLENRRTYNGLVAYGQSKLANVAFTIELARRIWGSGVTANAVHPGYVASDLGKNNAGFLKPLVKRLGLGGITPEEGAQPILYLASSPAVQGITARYFDKGKLALAESASDPANNALLWEVSASMVGLDEKIPS